MRNSPWFAWIAAITLLVALAARAQQDDPAVKDHPQIPRFPGTVITGGVEQDFGSHDFEQGEGKQPRAVEGRYWRIEYGVKEGAKTPAPLQVARNYGNEFKKRGGAVLFEQVDSGGGVATMRMPSGSGQLWMQLEINNGGEAMTFHIVAEGAMEQVVALSADEMGKALAASGRVALYGILFDTGKDTLKPGSEKELAQVAALLGRDASLKLRIEGHTDNVGKAADNMALSKRRAESVRRWLVAKGIADARLEAAGFGDSKPVAPNSAEEGRAKNRRVELVKK